MASYKKPDVEVFQQFRNQAGVMAPAVLQEVLVGPMYQLFNNEILGSYDNTENTYYLPQELLDTSQIDKETFKVEVDHYGETFHVAPSQRRVTSANGDVLDGMPELADDSVDFIAAGVVPHTNASSDDGDYVHIPVGANAGYYKVLEVVDSHNLVLDRNFTATNANEAYDIISVGYILDDSDPQHRTLILTPNLGFFGNTVVSFRALRLDHVAKPYYWDTTTAIENAAGEGQVTAANPLPHAASKALSVLGETSFIMALPTAGEDYAAYEAALEVLENEEVYVVVPLTQNKDIHMMVRDHVLAMSDPAEKKERVGIVSAEWMEERVKTGFFSVSDGITTSNGVSLDGQVPLGGESMYDGNDVVVYEEEVVICDGVEHTITNPTPQPNNRFVVNFGMSGDNIANGAVVQYELSSNPGTFINVATDTDPYHVAVQAPTNDTITSIKVTSGLIDNTKQFVVSTYNTEGEIAYTEYASVTASNQQVALDPRTDSLSITATEVANKRVALSGVPIDNDQVKVSIAGLQNFINGVDYVIKMVSGTAYIDWANKPMEDSVVQGQTMLASYQAATITIDEVVPTPGHKGLKVRLYNVGQANPDPLAQTKLPEGMKLYVITANHSYTLEYSGAYNFPEDIVEIYKVTSTKDPVSNSNVFVNVDLMIMTAAGTYERNRFVDTDAHFISKDNVVAGDILEIKNGASAGRYTITNVHSDTELELDTLWTVFEQNLEYQVVQTNLSKDDRAEIYKAYGEGFKTRRIVHVMAPLVGMVEDGVNLEVRPGWYAAVMVGAYAQAMAPQNGMTNMSIAGITRVFFTGDYFLERQLDTIASGGNMIITQPNEWVQPFIRHQLTTNMDTIEKREFSCVRALDYMAKMGRETYRPYIGRYLINEETMSTLYSVGNSLCSAWETAGLANQATLESVYVDPTQRDRVVVCIWLELPVPLNYIKLVLYV